MAIALGIIASILGFIGYIPYIRDMFAGKTKPHVFSWSVWGLLETIAFFAQITEGGGAGAWVTAVSAVVAFFVAGFALTKKDKQITFFDCVALSGAIIGIVLWRVTANPLSAVISVTIADAFGFFPTFRKAYYKPHEETLIEFLLSAVKWVIAIFALESLNPTTAIYPASLILTNSAFVLMLIVRRRVPSARPIAARDN